MLLSPLVGVHECECASVSVRVCECSSVCIWCYSPHNKTVSSATTEWQRFLAIVCVLHCSLWRSLFRRSQTELYNTTETIIITIIMIVIIITKSGFWLRLNGLCATSWTPKLDPHPLHMFRNIIIFFGVVWSKNDADNANVSPHRIQVSLYQETNTIDRQIILNWIYRLATVDSYCSRVSIFNSHNRDRIVC